MRLGPTLLTITALLGVVACGSLKEAEADVAPGTKPPSDGTMPSEGSGSSDDAAASKDGGEARGDGGLTPGGDPRFAGWPLPADEPPASSFTIRSTADGAIVTDLATGLAWQDAIPEILRTFADAQSYCASLVYGGEDDWRLPTRIEAISIMDIRPTFGESRVAASAFSSYGLPSTIFWTASQTTSPQSAYAVNAAGVSAQAVTSQGLARCVRGGAALATTPAAKAYVVEPTVVRDPATGLVWEKTPPEEKHTRETAETRCAAKQMRLPTVKELSSLVDETRSDPASNPALGSYAARMFTSNPRWLVDFADGSTFQAGGSTLPSWSRCVTTAP